MLAPLLPATARLPPCPPRTTMLAEAGLVAPGLLVRGVAPERELARVARAVASETPTRAVEADASCFKFKGASVCSDLPTLGTRRMVNLVFGCAGMDFCAFCRRVPPPKSSAAIKNGEVSWNLGKLMSSSSS